ncbi:hypothetical protein CDL15_Pgr023819 [Punica granatum]|uniref:Uncharacterized protein n=1 Tax=Punica granatum TaxID=22663 RepID=A0A218VZ58_PUNGR|nr:hypothetical protein CDL15_Pgr023819 [Punica granatum]
MNFVCRNSARSDSGYTLPKRGDSVERLEGCPGAKDARSGVYRRRARGQALGGMRGRAGRAAGCASERLGAAGARGARLCARARGSVRLRVHCSPESTSFTRNHLNDLK